MGKGDPLSTPLAVIAGASGFIGGAFKRDLESRCYRIRTIGRSPWHRTGGNRRFSWIHVDDVLGAVRFIDETPSVEGQVNLAAPGHGLGAATGPLHIPLVPDVVIPPEMGDLNGVACRQITRGLGRNLEA